MKKRYPGRTLSSYIYGPSLYQMALDTLTESCEQDDLDCFVQIERVLVPIDTPVLSQPISTSDPTHEVLLAIRVVVMLKAG
jgi:hypothetical protein